jgi:CheY-like chemotaxis protein
MEGYVVDTAENGEAAVQMAGGKSYDLAVCDLKMPGMDGVQTLAALKEIDPDMEVIIGTGYANVTTAIVCMKRGAYDYIQKPFDVDELRALVVQALAKRRLKEKIEELVSTRDKVVQSEKLTLAIQFAAAVAHEVNNPLGVLKANLYSLGRYFVDFRKLWDTAKETAGLLNDADGPEIRQLGNRLLNVCGGGEEEMDYQTDDAQQVLRECVDGVSRIANLVAGFQSLAQTHHTGQPQDVDVEGVVEECTRTDPEKPGTPRPILHEFEKAPLARAVPQDIQTALSNLIDYLQTCRPNSTKPITIRVKSEAERPCILVTDPSLQLSEEERLRIFDPRIDVNIRHGRTMRMNIGLAVAQQILLRNDAELTVRSRALGGSIFQVLLKNAGEKAPRSKST